MMLQGNDMQAGRDLSLPSSWRVRFFTVWTGQAVSLAGSALVSFALIWWLTETAASATTLSIASVLGWLPVIVLGPFAGVLVDRWDRRRVMIVADGSIALLTAVLAWLFWAGVAETWHVYVVLFLRSLGGAFHKPAMTSATSLMVPEDQLTRVSGLNATLQGILTFVSPALGALLLALLNVQGVLAIDIVTAAVAIVPLATVHLPEVTGTVLPGVAGTSASKRPIVQDLVEGFRYVWNQRGLFLLFVTATVGILFVQPALTFLPLLVTQHFRGTAMELGWMQSAYGLGYIAGGAALSVWGGSKRRMVTSIVGTVGIGTGILAMGLVPSTAFPLALAIWLSVGLMFPVALGPIRAIYQTSVRTDMQGRFFTLNDAVVRATSPLGLAVAGPVADAFGIRILWVIAGIALVGLAVTRLLTPTILHLGEPE
jgi:DHA3 family macrolide efflux protein-like MFS transporter